MNLSDRKGLKKIADSRLSEASYNPHRLMLLHTGASLGASLLIAIVSYILQQKIAATGGLSGIGLRSILTTAQSFLQLVLILLAPFWEIGFIYAAIRLARGQTASPEDLISGFRQFGPVLRLKLLQLFLYSSLAMPCMYVSLGIFGATPLSADFQALMMPALEQAMEMGQQIPVDAAAMEEMARTMIPLIPIFLIVYLAVLLPLFYRLRMAEYMIMDGNKSALRAMVESWRMTRKKAGALLHLDLSFWQFYVLLGLISVLAYGDKLLEALGVALPISEDGAYFLFYAIYILGTLAIYWCFGARLHTTYALAYETLCTPPEDGCAQ